MNANLDERNGVILWTGIAADKLSHERLLRAFKILAQTQLAQDAELRRGRIRLMMNPGERSFPCPLKQWSTASRGRS